MFTDFKSLIDLQDAFPTQQSCIDYMKLTLWGGEPKECPRCRCPKVYTCKGNAYRCHSCDRRFNVMTGTIFEGTKIGLRKWFVALYLHGASKRGISSPQLAKTLGIRQGTAWFLLHRIRIAYGNLSPESINGLAAVDETYIGGKMRNKHRDKKKKGSQGRSLVDKQLVFGAMEIDGNIKTSIIPVYNNKNLSDAVKDIVTEGSVVMSDEAHAYNHIGNGYSHDACDHAGKMYVSESGATTNHIENAWSHLKRTFIGTYYHVTPKHLQRYLFEFEYKFNSRFVVEPKRFHHLLSNCNGRLRYDDLVRKIF